MTVITAITTYLLIVWGGVVRVSGSGEGCGPSSGGANTWPLCYGHLWPPANQAGYIEFIHRWIAAVSETLVIVLAVWIFWRLRFSRRLVVAAALTLFLFLTQAVLGAITVLNHLPPTIILAHLANAEFLLAALLYIAVTAHTLGTGTEPRWNNPPSRARLAAGAALLTYAVLLTGGNVVAQGAGASCNAWPLCGNGGFGFTLAQTGLAAVNLFHRFGVLLVMLVVGSAVPMIRRANRGDRAIWWAGFAVNIILLAQIIAGALLVEQHDNPTVIKGIHLALASALWSSVVLLALLARRPTSAAMIRTATTQEPARVTVSPA